MFGLGVLAFELWRATEDGVFRPKVFLRSCLVTAPAFLSVLPLLAAGPTMGLSGENYWEASGKLEGLETIFTTYGDLVDIPIAVAFGAMVVWATRRRLLVAHPAMWYLAALGAIAYLAMPRMLFGSWFADHRLPIGLFFLLIGFIRLDAPDRRTRSALVAVMIGLALTRFVGRGGGMDPTRRGFRGLAERDVLHRSWKSRSRRACRSTGRKRRSRWIR